MTEGFSFDLPKGNDSRLGSKNRKQRRAAEKASFVAAGLHARGRNRRLLLNLAKSLKEQEV